VILQRLRQVRRYHRKGRPGDLVTKPIKPRSCNFRRFASSPSAIPSWQKNQAFGNTESEYLWAIDPLDGTTNYIPIPSFRCLHRVNDCRCTSTWSYFDPFHRSYFVPLKVGSHPQPTSYQGFRDSPVEQSLWSRALPMIAETADNNYAELSPLTHLTQSAAQRLSGAGSSSRCLWASGWLLGRGIAAWDIAAGVVLLEEGAK